MDKKYISKFDNYLIKEAKEVIEIPFYMSDKLTSILQRIKSDTVASTLLSDTSKHDISYLDIDKTDTNKITGLESSRINRFEGLDLNRKPSPDHEIWKSTLRMNTKCGNMINRLYPGKFTNVDIDKFYARFEPEVNSKGENPRFQLVKGEDIRTWYYEGKYDGQLGSCMRHQKCQPFFDIYVENPEKCSLLIYFSERDPNKVLARSLVWHNLMKPSGDTIEEKDPYTLMDRVYYVNNENKLEAIYHKYAIDHGWIYKQSDSFMMNGTRKTSSVVVRLKPKDYRYYPYMDTMYYYTPATGRASSVAGNPGRDPKDPSKIFPRYQLRSQEGGKQAVN